MIIIGFDIHVVVGCVAAIKAATTAIKRGGKLSLPQICTFQWILPRLYKKMTSDVGRASHCIKCHALVPAYTAMCASGHVLGE